MIGFYLIVSSCSGYTVCMRSSEGVECFNGQGAGARRVDGGAGRGQRQRPKTVFWTVHVAMTIALPGLVATAMTLQHMNLIAMQFAEGSVTQIF